MWITGQVVDDCGRGLRDVTIEASGPCGALRRATVTDAQGQYVLLDLRPGVYTVTFTRSGFSTLERSTDAPRSYVATIHARLQPQ
jgi:hypothetical protein